MYVRSLLAIVLCTFSLVTYAQQGSGVREISPAEINRMVEDAVAKTKRDKVEYATDIVEWDVKAKKRVELRVIVSRTFKDVDQEFKKSNGKPVELYVIREYLIDGKISRASSVPAKVKLSQPTLGAIIFNDLYALRAVDTEELVGYFIGPVMVDGTRPQGKFTVKDATPETGMISVDSGRYTIPLKDLFFPIQGIMNRHYLPLKKVDGLWEQDKKNLETKPEAEEEKK